MEQLSVFRSVLEILHRLDIRYGVGGSVVTIFYGEPRLTNDMDVVVDVDAQKLREMARAREEDTRAESGTRVRHLAPEHVILNTLLYYREGRSDKHIRDNADVLKISRRPVDLRRIWRWARVLDIEREWRTALECATLPTEPPSSEGAT